MTCTNTTWKEAAATKTHSYILRLQSTYQESMSITKKQVQIDGRGTRRVKQKGNARRRKQTFWSSRFMKLLCSLLTEVIPTNFAWSTRKLYQGVRNVRQGENVRKALELRTISLSCVKNTTNTANHELRLWANCERRVSVGFWKTYNRKALESVISAYL